MSAEESVIIGGGAAGTLVAVHLLRAGSRGPITIIERSDRLGRGVAYGTTLPGHLLNVVTSNLGGLSGQPEHFSQWLTETGHSPEPAGFLPRMVFGRYLTTLLAEVQKQYPNQLRVCRAEAVGVKRAGRELRVELADGGALNARRVILATGTPAAPNVALRRGRWPRDPRYVPDPWAKDAFDRSNDWRQVLLIGTGLTMVDVALRLIDDNPNIRLVGLSRTGLLPTPHRWPQGRVALGYEPPEPGTTLLQQIRAFRAEIATAQSRGGDARDVVDAMRPHTQAIWKGFSTADQRRFLLSYSRFWAINRNRIAPASHNWIEGLLESGRLTIVAGSVVGVAEVDRRLSVEVRRRGQQDIEAHQFDGIVNCTGPADTPFGTGSVLYDQMLADGLVRGHPLGLGLDTGDGGAVRDSAGRLSTDIFAIGWMRRGELWESVAIPELRDEAADIADRLSSA